MVPLLLSIEFWQDLALILGEVEEEMEDSENSESLSLYLFSLRGSVSVSCYLMYGCPAPPAPRESQSLLVNCSFPQETVLCRVMCSEQGYLVQQMVCSLEPLSLSEWWKPCC